LDTTQIDSYCSMNKEQTFRENVRKYFSFLLRLGYREAEPSDYIYGETRVSYMLDTLVIEVYFQQRGDEVGVNFGRRVRQEIEDYSFHMYLGIVDPSTHYKLGASIANSDNDVVELLEIYANALKSDGRKILDNVDEPFMQAREAARTGKGLCRPYYAQSGSRKIVSKFV